MFLRWFLYALVFMLCLPIFSKFQSRKIRQAILLIGSYVLYISWGIWFAGVLVASTLINFALGQRLRRNPSRLILTIGVLLNLALLSTFKYLPGMAASIALPFVRNFSQLALPLGISFWTFQAISYLFDLYRGEELDPSLFEFALYVVFFPITISGPICRLPDMLPQFRSENGLKSSNIRQGLCRIATGVLMMQLAQLLGQGILAGDGVSSGFDHAGHWSGPDVWCLVFGYGLQLFFDFAGYSHIAIGTAQVLGITIPENFNRPFASTSPSVFWTRWHISLSFWIRDYVFLPLAVLRREVWWRNFMLVVSMVLFGLWHKASVLFVIWGCYQGVLLVLHRQVQQLQRKLDWAPPSIWTPISWVATMALMNLGWVFFRAPSVPVAGQMLSAVLSPLSYGSHYLSTSLYLLVLTLMIGYAVVLLVIEMLDRYPTNSEGAIVPARQGLLVTLARNRWLWVPPLYALTLLVVLMVTLTRGPGAAQFMYRAF